MSTEEKVEPLALGTQSRDRLTIVEHIHFQHSSESPMSIGQPFARLLETQVEPYSRRITLTEERLLIDFGWVKSTDVGMLIVENLEGRKFDVNPSPEEMEEINGRIIEIYLHEDSWVPILVRPRAMQRLELDDFEPVRLRCRNGSAKCRITLIGR